MPKLFKDLLTPENINIFLISVLSIIIGIQVLVIVSFVFTFIPLKPSVQILVYQSDMRPEREMLLYRVFVLSVFLCQVICLWLFRKKMQSQELSSKLAHFVVMDGAILLLVLFMIFKLALSGFATGIKYYFYFFLLVAGISKISYRFLYSFIEKIGLFCEKYTWGVDLLVLLFVSACIYVPDVPWLLAQIFRYDKFYHWQAFIIEPGFAALKGCRLDVDIFSQYGIGMPLFIGQCSRLIGGFTYEHLAVIFLSMCIMYFILVYVFLRLWLKNIFVAVIGVIWAIKFQMFSFLEAVHVVWIYPSGTVVRYFFDIICFLFLALHLRYRSFRYLLIASVVVGMALFYVLDTGVSLALAFYAYLATFVLFAEQRVTFLAYSKDRVLFGVCCVLPCAVAFSLYWMAIGDNLLKPVFLSNFTEMLDFFAAGLGAMPLFDGIAMKEYAYFVIACLVPLVYLGTACIFVAKRGCRQGLLALVLSIYGLGIYQYFVCRSAPSSYFSVSVPLACILCYWLDQVVMVLNEKTRRILLVYIFIASILILLTSRLFLDYPHIGNVNREQADKDKKLMSEFMAIDQDVDLITRFTSPSDKVCLFASMAPTFLMQANRKPFLYYSNILPTHSFRTLFFAPFFLFTQKRVDRMFLSLEQEKPQYVFIEGRFLVGEASILGCVSQESFLRLTQYLREKYDLVGQGELLVALKRKPGL